MAVLSFRYAQKRFGDAAKAAGQAIRIDNQPFTIAGVSGPEFFGVSPGGAQDVFVPMHTSVLLNRRWPDEERPITRTATFTGWR